MLRNKIDHALSSANLKKLGLTGAAACAIMVGAPTVAMAQDTGDIAESDTIVVTARNREESIQDVPLAITAFDQEALKRRSITNLSDVARFTSGFSFEDFSGGFAVPVIRGQATTRVTALEGNVSTFYNGIYVPRSWAIDVGTASLERVEVVKGPQSARYGRNAFAGAVNYIPATAKPGAENLAFEATGTIGSDERYDLGAKANIPIGDIAGIAGYYNFSEFDGTWGNDHPFTAVDQNPSTNGNVGGWNRDSFGVSAIINPFESLTIEGSFDNFKNKNEQRPNKYYAEGIDNANSPFNCGTADRRGAGSLALICGELPGVDGDSVVVDPRAYGVQGDTDIFRARAAFDVTEEFEISYLFGKIKGDVDIAPSGEPDPVACGTLVGPPTFAPLCNFQQAPVGDINYDSHEVRFSYNGDGPFSGALGVFLSDGTDRFIFNSLNLAVITDDTDFQPAAGTPVPNFVFDPGPANFRLTNERTTTEVFSIFGEANWTSADERFRFGAEIRYSETEITGEELDDDVLLNDTFKVITPRISLEYDLSDETLLYGSVARGAKAGGFNPGAANPEDRIFNEEFNWTYEGGAKNTFLDGQLFLNLAAYYTDWADMQINSPDPGALDPNATNITLNLGDARVLGVELDARYQVNDNFSVDATLSHADAQYKDGTVDQRFARSPAPCDDVVCSSTGDVAGNDIERTPQTQMSFGAQWEGVLPNWDAEYYIRSDASWQSEFFASSANIGTIPDRFLVNATAGVSFDNVDLTLWARNVLDESYVSNAFVVLLPFGNTYGTFFGERRSYGATLRVHY